jgi:hypothetical protein
MGVSIEQELSVLEKRVRDLQVDYERYFAGVAKVVPVRPRQLLEEQFRKLANQEVDKLAERFRLQAIQARFNAFSDLWDRKIQALEEGKTLQTAHLKHGAGQPPVVTPSRASSPSGNAPPAATVKPKKVDFRPLFERYLSAKETAGEDTSKLRYERFEELVRKQAEEIRNKTGASRLVFEIKTDGGRVRLVGRPAPAKGTGQ